MAKQTIKIGDVVGIVKLKNMFDGYVQQVIHDRFKTVEQKRTGKKNPAAKLEIIKELPTLDEYRILKSERFETDVSALINDARSEVEELGSEMREWYENLTENLQQTGKSQSIEEAADALENVQIDDAPDFCSRLTLAFYPSLKCNSRADRCSEAVSRLRCAEEAIRDWVADNYSDDDEISKVKIDEEEIEVCWSTLEDVCNNLSEVADELEGVEFPGMFG